MESDSLADHQREQSDVPVERLEGVGQPKLDQVIDRQEMSACIQNYIDRLSDDYRITILLTDIDGMTCPEIAERLGCSLEIVKIRLHRAREKLKTVLSAVCNFSLDQSGTFVCESKHKIL